MHSLAILALPPVLLTQFQPAPEAPRADAVIHAVSPAELMRSVETLASFGTRHTLSDPDSATRGTGAARHWLKSQFESFRDSDPAASALQVQFEEFDIPAVQRLPDGAHLVNVLAILPGSMPEAAARRYYIVGHYDTINGDRMDPVADAPGANDDASGTAVVLEAARILSRAKLDATLVFLCTAAEEQGLLGAKYHAESAAARGDRILGVLSNDIVGDPSPLFISRESLAPGAPAATDSRTFVRLFSEALPRNPSAEQLAAIRANGMENDSPSRELARYVAYVARRERLALSDFAPRLTFRQDRFLRGGDHMAFNDLSFPAVRFSVPAEDYSRQHVNVTTRDGKPYGDLPAFVAADYLASVARLNIAALVHLANAPTPPANPRLITSELSTDTLIRWDASPEPDLAGYEILIRDTTAFDWQQSIDVGLVTEFRLPVSKDNYFFALRAYDRDGFRSPAAFCLSAPK